MLFVKGIGALLLTLAVFSFFSLKAPRGDRAMSGLANAAIATFLIEAICKYILGDLFSIPFFVSVGSSNGTLGGPAAAILVGLAMGTDPVLAVASGVALNGYGILPGFIAGYLSYFVTRYAEKLLPEGVDTILGAIISASLSYGIAYLADPLIGITVGSIGSAIMELTDKAPIFTGFMLGGIIKIICTSPLSSMALTAMLSLTGLPMGIAAIACFGGSFTNGMIFHGLKLGSGDKVLAVMLEPLTQADIITQNPIPIYTSNFFGGGLSGIAAAALGIICNAPGTAAPIPGMLAPFAFNPPGRVLLALVIAAFCGTLCGFIGSAIFKALNKRRIFLYKAALCNK